MIEVVDGEVFKGDRITAASTGETYEVLEVRFSCQPCLFTEQSYVIYI